jgi:hypothetical protein
MADSKLVQSMSKRTRASLEKTANRVGVKSIGRKNKLQLARAIDQTQKEAGKQFTREAKRARTFETAGEKFAARPEEKRTGINVGYRDSRGKYHRYYNSAAFWKAYRKAMGY